MQRGNIECWESLVTLKQRGAALLMLMLIIVLVVTVGLFSIHDPESKRNKLRQTTQESLARAKEALISFAITQYEQKPGVFAGLPCVDDGTQNEGVQAANCGTNNANEIGRLPWATLNIDTLRDGSGECLWYAISGHHKNNNSAMLLNEDSPGLLRLYQSDGVIELTPNTSQGRIVAAVIAPGPAISGQNRNSDPAKVCGGNYNPADFLETVGNAANAGFSNLPYQVDGIAQGDEISEKNPNVNSRINDRLITITRQEIWSAIQTRPYPNIVGGAYHPYTDPASDIFREFTRELAECIASFGLIHGGNDFRLPWAVPVDLDLGTRTAQLYSQQTNYKDNSGRFGGRFPFDISVTIADATYSPSVTYPQPQTLFTEGRCTAFVDLSNPAESSPALPQHPSYPLYRNLWNHWKDHVFYAVSAAFAPNTVLPAAPVICTPPGPGRDCLSVNGAGDYAAIVMFAGSPLVGQSRDAPPDNDDKAVSSNYLDAGNNNILDNENGSSDYVNGGGNFNDILYCIQSDMTVVPC